MCLSLDHGYDGCLFSVASQVQDWRLCAALRNWRALRMARVNLYIVRRMRVTGVAQAAEITPAARSSPLARGPEIHTMRVCNFGRRLNAQDAGHLL